MPIPIITRLMAVMQDGGREIPNGLTCPHESSMRQFSGEQE